MRQEQIRRRPQRRRRAEPDWTEPADLRDEALTDDTDDTLADIDAALADDGGSE